MTVRFQLARPFCCSSTISQRPCCIKVNTIGGTKVGTLGGIPILTLKEIRLFLCRLCRHMKEKPTAVTVFEGTVLGTFRAHFAIGNQIPSCSLRTESKPFIFPTHIDSWHEKAPGGVDERKDEIPGAKSKYTTCLKQRKGRAARKKPKRTARPTMPGNGR